MSGWSVARIQLKLEKKHGNYFNGGKNPKIGSIVYESNPLIIEYPKTNTHTYTNMGNGSRASTTLAKEDEEKQSAEK